MEALIKAVSPSFVAVSGFATPPALRVVAPARARSAAALPTAIVAAPRQAQIRARGEVRMGLFGLGWPEIGVITVIAVFFFGPDKLAPMAKEFGARMHAACAQCCVLLL